MQSFRRHSLSSRCFFGLCWVLSVLSTSQARLVIVTTTLSTTQWTCFEVDSHEDCCRFIELASKEAAIDYPEFAFCRAKLAEVPRSIAEPLQVSRSEVARFSLTVRSEHRSIQQFLWEKNDEVQKLGERTKIGLPFLFSDAAEMSTNSTFIRSRLSASGGMHRLLNHDLEIPDEAESCILLFTITDSMFMDLDDAFEGLGQVAEEFKLHHIGICDIEQPSFASTQYVIAAELSDTKMKSFSSKLHLRYPHPSPDHEQYVILPEPRLVCRMSDGMLQVASQWEDQDQIWVAAGSASDYDLVMWTTLVACCVGLVWMMSDISYVARWDP